MCKEKFQEKKFLILIVDVVNLLYEGNFELIKQVFNDEEIKDVKYVQMLMI